MRHETSAGGEHQTFHGSSSRSFGFRRTRPSGAGPRGHKRSHKTRHGTAQRKALNMSTTRTGISSCASMTSNLRRERRFTRVCVYIQCVVVQKEQEPKNPFVSFENLPLHRLLDADGRPAHAVAEFSRALPHVERPQLGPFALVAFAAPRWHDRVPPAVGARSSGKKNTTR